MRIIKALSLPIAFLVPVAVLAAPTRPPRSPTHGEGPRTGLEQGLETGLLEGRLTEARAALRRVLARRHLTPSKDGDARIAACTDLEILERWLDRAVAAARMADVLR